jgi:hypothetical protein
MLFVVESIQLVQPGIIVRTYLRFAPANDVLLRYGSQPMRTALLSGTARRAGDYLAAKRDSSHPKHDFPKHGNPEHDDTARGDANSPAAHRGRHSWNASDHQSGRRAAPIGAWNDDSLARHHFSASRYVQSGRDVHAPALQPSTGSDDPAGRQLSNGPWGIWNRNELSAAGGPLWQFDDDARARLTHKWTKRGSEPQRLRFWLSVE